MRPLARFPGRTGNGAHLGDGYGSSLSSAQCKRLEGGLDKLKEATIQLDELNQKLAEQKVVLAEKSAACEALLEEIATNTAIGECGASSGGRDPPDGAGLHWGTFLRSHLEGHCFSPEHDAHSRMWTLQAAPTGCPPHRARLRVIPAPSHAAQPQSHLP